MASPRLPAATLARLYAQSHAERWHLSRDRFEAALASAIAHRFPDAAAADDVERYAAGLHLDDLALAAACADGSDPAWSHFITEFRPALYRAADAMAPGGGAREVADALYADLFGLTERDGVRQSLLRHFHARSRLATWLRAVLSQRYVDRIRSTRRLDPLPDDSGLSGASVEAAPPPDPEARRFAALVHRGLAAAIAMLAPRDRLRLDSYYLQDLTLAAIGRLLGEHEATVSRHLARTRRDIRASVERVLREEHGLDAAAIAECFEAAVRDSGTLDMAELVGSAAPGKKPGRDRSS